MLDFALIYRLSAAEKPEPIDPGWDDGWLATHCLGDPNPALIGPCFLGLACGDLHRPRVVNRHHFKGKATPEPSIYIGRGTPLGNPYKVKEHGLAALDLYRRWLWGKIKDRDPQVLRALAAITGDHHLVCSCKPRPCHGDVVVRAWAWLRRQE